MNCKLMATAISVEPFGTAKAICHCETHNWRFDGPATDPCPIGQIEQAAKAAIDRIGDAATDAIGSVLDVKS